MRGLTRSGTLLRAFDNEVSRVERRPASERSEAGAYARRLSAVPRGRRALEVPPWLSAAVPRVAA